MSGRKGKSGHQNLIQMASKKLLNKIVGDDYLTITFVRENPMDVRTKTEVQGEQFGHYRVALAELRMYADIACAVVYDKNAKIHFDKEVHERPEFADKTADKFSREGNMVEYYKAIRKAYGCVIYIIECEINPKSHLLKDGPRLTAYKLIKQQNNNVVLILAVFEGTKVDNPHVFDEVWYFPKKVKP